MHLIARLISFCKYSHNIDPMNKYKVVYFLYIVLGYIKREGPLLSNLKFESMR